MTIREIWNELREECRYPAELKPGDRGFSSKRDFYLFLLFMWTFRLIILLFVGAMVVSLFLPQCKCCS